MLLRSRALVLLVCALAGAGAACDDTTGFTSTTPDPIPTTTETFAGTLTRNGAMTHQFSVTARGAVTATLTKVEPDATATIGVSLGTWNGTSCQIILANDQTTVGSGLLGTVSGVGILCLRVYDVGKLTSAADYSVDVVHP